MDGLYKKLQNYRNQDIYPMHMPGHKRNAAIMSMDNPYSIDITEINGFDNLHHPEGILKKLSLEIKKLYGSFESYPLVNGSTSGILAAISAGTKMGDKILVARNCHKSVYHAVELRRLEPVYLYPERIEDLPVPGGILPEKVEEALINNPEIRLVVITSPTYEGVLSDIKEIAKRVHRHQGVLVVDEAHGAHLGLYGVFPESAVRLGADFVIQSLHKTLPSFTQTAVLHNNRPDFSEKIRHYLGIYQSSSPSYLLMAGIDRCISFLNERGKSIFEEHQKRLNVFYHEMKGLKYLRLLDDFIIGKGGVFDFDRSKITILTGTSGLTGGELSDTLRRRYRIEMELEATGYTLGITGICDTQEGLERLKNGLWDIDRDRGMLYSQRDKNQWDPQQSNRYAYSLPAIQPEIVMPPGQAGEADTVSVGLQESLGLVSACYLMIYPPGIPLIVPGERITGEVLDILVEAVELGLNVIGLRGENETELLVVRG